MGFGLGLPLGQLNLTEGQREQIKAVAERHRPELRAAGEKLAAARQALMDASQAVPLNEGAIRTAADALGAAEADAAVSRARAYNDTFALLTPEQQAKAKQIASERDARMKERRQHMRERLRERGSRQR